MAMDFEKIQCLGPLIPATEATDENCCGGREKGLIPMRIELRWVSEVLPLDAKKYAPVNVSPSCSVDTASHDDLLSSTELPEQLSANSVRSLNGAPDQTEEPLSEGSSTPGQSDFLHEAFECAKHKFGQPFSGFKNITWEELSEAVQFQIIKNLTMLHQARESSSRAKSDFDGVVDALRDIDWKTFQEKADEHASAENLMSVADFLIIGSLVVWLCCDASAFVTMLLVNSPPIETNIKSARKLTATAKYPGYFHRVYVRYSSSSSDCTERGFDR